MQGRATSEPLGLTGSWNAAVKRKGKTFNEEFIATASSNYPAVFDIAGQGLSDTGSFTLSGEIIISAEDKVNASIDRTFGTDVREFRCPGCSSPRETKCCWKAAMTPTRTCPKPPRDSALQSY